MRDQQAVKPPSGVLCFVRNLESLWVGGLDPFGYIFNIFDPLKPLHWVSSLKKDLLAMPRDVVDVFGFALHLAQSGKKHDQTKPLQGFGGAGVVEVVEDHMGDTFRAV